MFSTRKLAERPGDLLNWEVDLSHPLTPSEAFLVFDNGRVYNLIDEDQRSVSVGAGVSFGSDNEGEYASFNGTSSAIIQQTAIAGSGLNEQTIITQSSFSGATDHGILVWATNVSDQDLLFWADVNGGNLRPALFAGSAIYGADDSIPKDGSYITIGATAKNTGDLGELFLNGKSVASGSIGTNNFGASSRIYLGNNKAANRAMSGNMQFLYLDNVIRTDSEIEEISANPWQILKPRRRLHIVPTAAAGTTYTLTADAGSYTQTGTAATLIRERTLTADAGAYSYTGTAATLTYTPAGITYTIAADTGSYSYTGVSATLAFNRALNGDVGTYSYAGTAATLTRSRTISADAGSYSYTGVNAALAFNRALVADPGAYVYSGTLANLSHVIPGQLGSAVIMTPRLEDRIMTPALKDKTMVFRR